MALTTEAIKQNSEVFIVSVYSYYYRSLRLMHALCAKLGYSEEDLNESFIQKVLPDSQSGTLDEEWDYFFHGGQCKFENIKTGQIVDIQLKGYPSLVKMLDPGFYMKYVNTTKELSIARNLLENDYGNVSIVISMLQDIYADNVNSFSDYYSFLQKHFNDFKEGRLSDDDFEKYLLGEEVKTPHTPKDGDEAIPNSVINAITEKLSEYKGIEISREEINMLPDKIAKGEGPE